MILVRTGPPAVHFPTVTTIVNVLQDFTEKIVKLSSMPVTEIPAQTVQHARSWKQEDSRKGIIYKLRNAILRNLYFGPPPHSVTTLYPCPNPYALA